MTNWPRIVVCCLVLLFVVLSLQSVEAKRSGNKVEKVKDRLQREEKRHLKKEGKKIKKSFSKKFEQLYFSLCPDCYSKLLQASESCSQNYEKLELSKDKIDKCKEKSREKSKKKKKNLDNSIEEGISSKGWKDIYEKETKTLECLFDVLREQEKYRNSSKDEFRKEKNNLTSQLLQDKTECIKKQLQAGNLPGNKVN